MLSPSLAHMVEIEQIGIVTVARVLTDDLMDTQAATFVSDQLGRLADEPGRRVVVNLANVQAMSSNMIGCLIGLCKRLGRAGGRLAVCELTPTVSHLFRLLALDQLFDIFAGEPEAAERLS